MYLNIDKSNIISNIQKIESSLILSPFMTTYFLFYLGLASFDSILITTSILMFGLPAVHTYTQEYDTLSVYFYQVFPYITPIVYPVGMIAQTGSVYLTMCKYSK